MPLVVRRVVEDPLVVPCPPPCLPAPKLLVVEDGVTPVRPRPLPLPLDAPLETLAAASALRRSSSSAFRAVAALCSCSSYSLRSSACCFTRVSCSASATSWLAPCQDGLSISLWLCSVCERILVQVERREEAAETVVLTVYKVG
jgi:hypothetical protein